MSDLEVDINIGDDGDSNPTMQATGPMASLAELCRPNQWTKNAFVLAPLLFSFQFTRIGPIVQAFLATLCFCLLSSAVYVVNDLIDAESDRCHPRKKSRPVASGRVSSAQAVWLAAILMAASYVLALLFLPTPFTGFLTAYLANSLLYCF